MNKGAKTKFLEENNNKSLWTWARQSIGTTGKAQVTKEEIMLQRVTSKKWKDNLLNGENICKSCVWLGACIQNVY